MSDASEIGKALEFPQFVTNDMRLGMLQGHCTTTTRGCHTIGPSSCFRVDSIVRKVSGLFCSNLPVKRCEGDRALPFVLNVVCEIL